MEQTGTATIEERAAAADTVAITDEQVRAGRRAWAQTGGLAVAVGQVIVVGSAAVLASADEAHYRAPALAGCLLATLAVIIGHRMMRHAAS
ncbi:MAG: hypothetical protein M3Y87_05035, partial [Myxococcota bacterium]|nr:hypothetical protein [Myxococcota bacterium]